MTLEKHEEDYKTRHNGFFGLKERLLNAFSFHRKSDVENLENDRREQEKKRKKQEERENKLKEKPILKYSKDKEGALSCIADDPLLFMEQVDRFKFKNGLDEEVVKSLLQKIEYMIENELTTRDVGGVLTISSHDDYIREILRYLGKFLNDVVVESDCGYDFIKYLCNRVERQEGADRLYIENIDSLGKKEKYCFLLPTNVNPFYISSSGKGSISYIVNYIRFVDNLTYNLLMKKSKNKYDLNDADLLNCVMGRIIGKQGGGRVQELKSMRDWLMSNILKFPDQSLDYCIFRYIVKTEAGKNLFEKDRFLLNKFKKYPVTYANKDDFFETLYRDTYINRDKNLLSMDVMSFPELLTLYLSTSEKGKEGVKDEEIEDLLISKDVQSGEVPVDLMNRLLEKLENDNNKKFLKRIKKKFKKISLS